MKLLHRIGYFSVGFVIGIIILFFVLSGKRASCAYGPQARTLKNIRLKERGWTPEATAFFQQNKMDTSAISALLTEGKVLFSESNIRLDSCKQYVIRGKSTEKTIKVRIENCDEKATVLSAQYLD